MCGFGDKDRRPITPPICVRLQITGNDGLDVDVKHIDTSFFVLAVDLWSQDGATELNTVRHSPSTHNISTATSTPFPFFAPAKTEPPAWSPSGANDDTARQFGSSFQYPFNDHQTIGDFYNQPGTYSGNLIGSRHASASKLTDANDRYGIWFILQDLSVRTEGRYRLRCDFLNLCRREDLQINTGPANVSCVSCSVFSQPFTVYSAKKFPGMIESTALSKAFARQGIKIPVRKDGPKALYERQGEGEDAEE